MSKAKPEFTLWGNGTGKKKIIKGTKAIIGIVAAGLALGLGLKAAGSVSS